MRPTLELIDKFADEIEFDLHAHVGLDLLDWFRGRYSWAKLWRLLALLPWHSRYKLAVDDDDELGRARLEAEGSGDPLANTPPSRPSLRNWDALLELQATLTDGFNNLVASNAGQKAKRPKPVPRPETGLERARRERDTATVNDLFATFTPGR